MTRWMFAATVFLSMACAGDDPTDVLDRSTHIVDPADLTIVGTSESIATIVDLMPMGDDSVWVLNNTEPFLVQLSPEGSELRVQGRIGGGPGEFSWPSTLVRDPFSDTVWVYDTVLGQLIATDRSDDRPDVFALPPDSSGRVGMSSHEWLWLNNGGRVWLHASDEGVTYARPQFSSPWIHSLWSTEVVRAGWDGSLEHVAWTAEVVGDSSSRFPGAELLLPYPIWAACPDGSLAVYDPNGNTVRRFAEAGGPLESRALPAERRESVTTDRLFSAVFPGTFRNRQMTVVPERDVFYEMIRRSYEDRIDRFAAVFPEYAHMDCSEDNTL